MDFRDLRSQGEMWIAFGAVHYPNNPRELDTGCEKILENLMTRGEKLSETRGTAPKGAFKISNPRDVYGGLALVALSIFAFWACSDLAGMRGYAFGAGTAPRLFAGLLGVFGAIVALIGLFTEGPPVEPFAYRGPIFITVAVVIFAFTVRPQGLVFSSFISIVVAAYGSPEAKLGTTLIWSAILTIFCALLFPFGLNLPMPLWPNWLLPYIPSLHF
jgi:putative tricarboxylic transport membrane protein